LAAVRAAELRRDLTVSEAKVWQGLKGGSCGARFRRQVPIGIHIVDFASFFPRLVVEIDDESHTFRDEDARSDYVEARGFPILRFTNLDVRDDVGSVLSTISYWVEHLNRSGRPPD
jgi:very-short-patch-repair endonuclease